MRLYVLDTNPEEAARFHNDRHVSKAILDAVQMLSMAHTFLDGVATARARSIPIIERDSHTSHPCVVWARHRSGNYEWIYSMLVALHDQWELRFNKPHAYGPLSGVIERLKAKPMNIVIGPQTDFPICMPVQYKRSSAVESYRLYYFGEKAAYDHRDPNDKNSRIGEWSPPSSKPDWWVALEERQIA